MVVRDFDGLYKVNSGRLNWGGVLTCKRNNEDVRILF